MVTFLLFIVQKVFTMAENFENVLCECKVFEPFKDRQNIPETVCKDTCNGTLIDKITFMNITSYLPESLNELTPDLKVLEAINKSISTITSYNFEKLFKLAEIYLQFNQIISIGDNTFNDLEKLRVLNLSSNKIGVFPYDSLKNKKNFEIFDVSNNTFILGPKEIFLEDALLKCRKERFDTATKCTTNKNSDITNSDSDCSCIGTTENYYQPVVGFLAYLVADLSLALIYMCSINLKMRKDSY